MNANQSEDIHRMRRNAHLNSEKKRRSKLNTAFDDLRDAVPAMRENPSRATKITILLEGKQIQTHAWHLAAMRIKQLEKKNSELQAQLLRNL